MPAARSTVAMARELIMRKRYSQAIDMLNDKLARNPDDLNALEALGLAYFELQDYAAVERLAFQTTRLASTRARTWCNWGMALRKLGKLEEAREAQERALHLDPTCRRAQIELAKIDRLEWDAPAIDELPLPRLSTVKKGRTRRKSLRTDGTARSADAGWRPVNSSARAAGENRP